MEKQSATEKEFDYFEKIVLVLPSNDAIDAWYDELFDIPEDLSLVLDKKLFRFIVEAFAKNLDIQVIEKELTISLSPKQHGDS